MLNQTKSKYMDTHTLHVESGVANERQLVEVLTKAVKDAEDYLGWENKTRFKVNLIVGKNGEYFGYGYVRISKPEVYWLLLGKNPDGSDRYEEYPDPNWTPPKLDNSKDKNLESKSWAQIAEEEEAMIHPMIRKNLPPLITIPGYEYDEEQKAHLLSLKKEGGDEDKKEKEGDGDNKKDDNKKEIPNMGYIIISRAYASDPEDSNMLKNRICATKIPEWIPKEAFKSIFSFYTSEESRNKKGTVYLDNEKEITETYPIVHFVDTKKVGRMAFITFDPATKDCLFALLMTKKTRLINPKNPTEKATIVFTHAYDTNALRNRRKV